MKWKMIAVVVVGLLVLFGLYWGGRQIFFQPGGEEEQLDADTIAAKACANIDRDLLTALSEAGQNKRAVCGIDISEQRKTEFTFGISNLDQLAVIRANDNLITRLPSWLSVLDNLQLIEIRNNRIELVPEGLGELPNLKILDLRGNPLRPGEIERVREMLPQTEVRF